MINLYNNLLIFLIFVITTNAFADDSPFLRQEQKFREHILEVEEAVKTNKLDLVVNAIRNRISDIDISSDVYEFWIEGVDQVKRPFNLFIPKTYNSSQATPLLVYLHGGVMRESIIENREEFVQKNDYLDLAKKHGFPILFPFADKTSMWWNPVGIANILMGINKIKRNFIIDDNRVWISGFSDGASASFFLAMSFPSQFAGFIPLSGHMGVGSLDGGWELFPENMSQSSILAFNTDEDNLYPTSKMRPMIDMANRAGADINFKNYSGYEHDSSYVKEKAISMIENFLLNTTRNDSPSSLSWTSAVPAFSTNRWIDIVKVDPDYIQLDWHQEYNLELINDRVSIGLTQVRPSDNGMVVLEFNEGSFIESFGIEREDVMMSLNNIILTTFDVLVDAIKTLKRGDSLEIEIIRDGKKQILKGQIPPISKYKLFPHEKPAGAIRASFDRLTNTFYVESSQISSFKILINPDIVDLKRTLIIKANGRIVYNKNIEIDFEYLKNTYFSSLDRNDLYVGEVEIKLGLRQF